ncbi:MAG: hypothetical protein GKR91_06355 [Pseudomonadales bacterium]|nr:hypothetical protein [Pseudomonadales bacterium]
MDDQNPTAETSALRHIPNGITSLRILVAAVFPFSPEAAHLWLVIAGLLTEFFDGFIARTFKWSSYLGQVLDPVADKLFVLSVSLTWVWLGKLTILQWLLLGARDFGVLFIFLGLIATGKIRRVQSVKAKMPSKITTALQYLLFLLVLTGSSTYLDTLALLTAGIGLVATVQYGYLLRHSFK